MAFTIVLQGTPKDLSVSTDNCPECGNRISLRLYRSLPFANLPSIELEVFGVICETCDTHIVICGVNYNEAESTPPPQNSVQPRKSRTITDD